jgi:hypothetical protein
MDVDNKTVVNPEGDTSPSPAPTDAGQEGDVNYQELYEQSQSKIEELTNQNTDLNDVIDIINSEYTETPSGKEGTQPPPTEGEKPHLQRPELFKKLDEKQKAMQERENQFAIQQEMAKVSKQYGFDKDDQKAMIQYAIDNKVTIAVASELYALKNKENIEARNQLTSSGVTHPTTNGNAPKTPKEARENAERIFREMEHPA